jgi:hypothetical protein
MKSLLLVAFCAPLLAGGCDSETFRAQLAGRWVSGSCEPTGSGTYLKRDFTLNESTWALVATLYSDATCQQRSAALEADGSYEIKEASLTVPGSTEVDYTIARRRITAYTTPALAALTADGCGPAPRAIDQPLDVTRTGCPSFKIPPQCSVELDLNKLDGDLLYFGDRSASPCLARPAQLDSIAVLRDR